MTDVTEKKTKSSLKQKIKAANAVIKSRLLDVILKSWKGSAIGALIGIVLYLAALNTHLETGFGWYVDLFLVLIQMSLVIFGFGFLGKKLFKTIKKFDPRFAAVMFIAGLTLSFFPQSFFGKILVIFFFICSGLIGFAISRGIKKPVSIIIVFITTVFMVYSFLELFGSGTDETISVSDKYWNQTASAGKISDLSFNGSYKVKYLTYGSGSDYRRKEYGSNVTLKTKSVDATPFFDRSEGFPNYLRKLYWKFNSKNYPLNARVWYPDANGVFPLVLIVHGNHSMTEYSDPGYEYLGKLCAGNGYIFASVDENFLNGSWMNDYQQEEVFTRGWLLLKHLEQWKKWNETGGNPFSNKVDMNNIVLMGHSRGGASAAVAAAVNKLKRYFGDAKQEFNFNFGIKGIVQIAPNDPYKPQNEIPLQLENINYLILQGGYDQDMSFFMGNRMYNRLVFNDDQYHFKSALYIYRANHGQFNTEWGRNDFSIPNCWFLNTKPIMDPEAQRRIAKIFISAFLETTLKGRNDYIKLMRDYRTGNNFLPKDYYINQFEDSGFKYVADYQEDFDVTTSSSGGEITGKNLKVWSENALYFRDEGGSSQYNLGVYLGWDKKDTTLKNKIAEYSLMLNDSSRKILEIGKAKNLCFFVCNNKEDINTVDFSIKLISDKDSSSVSLSDKFILPPPLKTKLTKWNQLYSINKDKQVERVLQLVEIPFTDFMNANKKFTLENLKEIKFVFDKTGKGEIFLDKIGFSR